MRFGIIGTGMIANFHAKAIAAIEGVSLTGICGSSLEKSQAFAQSYNCKAYDSVEALCNSDIDIVTIATPSGLHLDHCIVAFLFVVLM